MQPPRHNAPTRTPATRNGHGPHVPSADELEALAALFLGPAPGGRTLAGADRPALEAIVLGHLPVVAGAWASQYARHRAGELAGPVALLRHASGHTTIDLVTPTPLGLTPRDTIDQAIAEAARVARAWIVRLDTSAGTRDLSLFDAVTLLTGADEAAVVACYAAMKSLPKSAAPRVAFMGCDAPQAAGAYARLDRAAREFLGSPLAGYVCITRVGATPMLQVYRGPGGTPDADLVRRVRAAGEREAFETAAPRPSPQQGASSNGGELEENTAPPSPVAEFLAAESAGLPENATNGRHEQPAGATHAAPPLPSPVESPRAPSAAGLVEGLTPLHARCPVAPGVELACDDTGRLHLLAMPPRDHSGQTLHAAVRRLLAARAWSTRHRELLCAAEPALRAETPVMMHLLTETPGEASDLLDTEIRVHAVVRARPDAVGAAPLN